MTCIASDNLKSYLASVEKRKHIYMYAYSILTFNNKGNFTLLFFCYQFKEH